MPTQTIPAIPSGLARWLAGKGLTPRERDVVAAYLQLREAGDGVIGPTQAEMADALGIARSAVNEHIGKLVSKGVFERANYKRAGLRLLWDERAVNGSGAASLRSEARLVVKFLRSVARTSDGLNESLCCHATEWADRLRAAVEESE